MIITVIGHATRTHAPQLAHVHIVVSVDSDDAAVSMRDAQLAAATLRSDLEKLEAFTPSAITRYSIDAPTTTSWRPYSNDGSIQPPRFATSIRIDVTFTDFAVLSSRCASWGATPNVSLREVLWDLTDATRSQLNEEVQKGAVANAVERATIMAHATGKSTIVVTEIADPGFLDRSGETPAPRPLASMTRAVFSDGAQTGVELAPQDIILSADVHVRCTTPTGHADEGSISGVVEEAMTSR